MVVEARLFLAGVSWFLSFSSSRSMDAAARVGRRDGLPPPLPPTLDPWEGTGGGAAASAKEEDKEVLFELREAARSSGPLPAGASPRQPC